MFNQSKPGDRLEDNTLDTENNLFNFSVFKFLDTQFQASISIGLQNSSMLLAFLYYVSKLVRI